MEARATYPRFCKMTCGIFQDAFRAERNETCAAGRSNSEGGVWVLFYLWIATPHYGRLAMTLCELSGFDIFFHS